MANRALQGPVWPWARPLRQETSRRGQPGRPRSQDLLVDPVSQGAALAAEWAGCAEQAGDDVAEDVAQEAGRGAQEHGLQACHERVLPGRQGLGESDAK